MRIAAYSDVHGNTPGLAAVHAAIDASGPVDLEICLGDAVYGGPGTVEIVEALRSRGVTFLKGNHDEDLAGFEQVLLTLEEGHRAAAKTWNTWLLSRLTPRDIDWLTGGRLTHRVTLPDGTRLLFCHAGPESTSVRLAGPDAAEADRSGCLERVDADILCTGHWHSPVFMRWRNLGVTSHSNPAGFCTLFWTARSFDLLN
jgi:predicted phosphodiesterase